MERMDAAKPLLEVRHLNIAFASGKKLTRRTEDVHFQIRPGEISMQLTTCLSLFLRGKPLGL